MKKPSGFMPLGFSLNDEMGNLHKEKTQMH